MSNTAERVTADIQAKLLAMAGQPFRDGIFSVQSQEDFEEQAKLMTAPYAGVMYSGIQADDSADQSKKGMFGRAVVAIIYAVSSMRVVDDPQTDAWDLMARGRKAIRLTKSPTGHDWRFRQEKYFESDNGVAYYTQVWDTGAPLTGENA